MRTFRFMVTLPSPSAGLEAWRDDLARVEDAGIDTVAVADHFTSGWSYEPLVLLAAAAQHTDALRLQTNVLCNDYRHPVQLHRMAATLDVVSAGRLELGVGAGWLRADYEAAGIDFDRGGVRVDRLAESLRILKALFQPGPATIHGSYYRVEGLVGVPSPVQVPHPPIFLGGGGRRVLSLAAREADIVGIHAALGAGQVTAAVVAEMTPARVAEKVGWVRDAALGAGRDPATLELHMNFRLCAIRSSSAVAREEVRRYAAAQGVTEEIVRMSPQVLAGTPAECAEGLLQRRDDYGITYFHFDPQVKGGTAGLLDGYRSVVALVREQE